MLYLHVFENKQRVLMVIKHYLYLNIFQLTLIFFYRATDVTVFLVGFAHTAFFICQFFP